MATDVNQRQINFSAYESLKAHFSKIEKLILSTHILYNDMEISMPEGGEGDRSEMITAIDMSAHALKTDEKVAQWFEEIDSFKADLPDLDQRHLELMRLEWRDACSRSDELVERFSNIQSKGLSVHKDCREIGDIKKATEWLKYCFDTAREIGEVKAKLGGFDTAYEGLLDAYGPGLKLADVQSQFQDLNDFLKILIPQVIAEKEDDQMNAQQSSFDLESQKKLNLKIVEMMGFDLKRGRLDFFDGHPSSMGPRNDVRLTTVLQEGDFLTGLYGSIHEAGHGIYTQNLPAEYNFQTLGKDLGYAVHESQSHIMDEQACKTPEFFRLLSRHAKDVFNRSVADEELSAENLQALSSQAKPSYIRIDADELTYPMHVILRFELEKAIIDGDLSVDDLPEAWWAGIKEKLGLDPVAHEKGFMQDVHWFTADQGYFPSYTIGSMMAAQFYAAAVKMTPDLGNQIEQGNFSPLTKWLKKNVHGRGAMVSTEQLLINATGEGLNARYYMDSLSQKYLGRSFSV